MAETSTTDNNKSMKMAALLSCASIVVILLSFASGMLGGYLGSRVPYTESDGVSSPTRTTVQVSEESAIIDVAKASTPSVVSIVVTKDLPIYESYTDPFFEDFGFNSRFWRRDTGETETYEIGAGSGFIVSKEGLIVTNKHVVDDTDADYTVVLNDGTQIKADVLARDSVLDVAIIKINPSGLDLSSLPIGDSDSLQLGQTVIAIGNSLGEFSNTVSSGIISGLSRSIYAGDELGRSTELLEGVIQTDASINFGNSGGPLLDILGNVIGVNVAIAEDAENISFAIPINSVKKIIESVEKYGEIRRPYLGVRYLPITPDLKEEEDLDVDYGALLVRGEGGGRAVLKDSPAAKAGLKEGDQIIAINNVKLDSSTSLQGEIQGYEVGETVSITYVRDGEEFTVDAVLELSNS